MKILLNSKVRVKGGNIYAGARGVVVETIGNLFGVKLDGMTGIVDYTESELTVLN